MVEKPENDNDDAKYKLPKSKNITTQMNVALWNITQNIVEIVDF